MSGMIIMKHDIEKLLDVNTEILTEQKEKLPSDADVKEGQLHKALKIPKDKDISDYTVEELVKKQKQQINSGTSYQGIIQKLNWQQVVNKNSNPSVESKFRSVMKQLKTWHEKDNK